MKLPFDQNLSYKLAHRLADLFPDSTHVREVSLQEADDSVGWESAKQHGFVIVSKDSDFHQRSFVWGFPPKQRGYALRRQNSGAHPDTHSS